MLLILFSDTKFLMTGPGVLMKLVLVDLRSSVELRSVFTFISSYPIRYLQFQNHTHFWLTHLSRKRVIINTQRININNAGK